MYFINLGGYRPQEFDEPHYKLLAVAVSKAEAIRQAKSTAFFRHTGLPGAPAHIDDKWGVDVDDFWEVEDILPPAMRAAYTLSIMPGEVQEVALHLGYLPLYRVK